MSYVARTARRREGLKRLSAGESITKVAKALGVHRTTVYVWLKSEN